VFRGEVLDCFPEADSHKGCPLPEHIGAFVFPEGLSLRTTEQPPVMFHFVLTNVTGVKVSVVALLILSSAVVVLLTDGNEVAVEATAAAVAVLASKTPSA
jgi:uDENN domain